MKRTRDEENRSDINSQKNNLNPDLTDDPTQKIDCHFSPGDTADDFLCHANTMPTADNFMWQDAFQTQLVDSSGETQVMDFCGETQDLNDLDCFKILPTDVFDEYNGEAASISDSEGTNKTEVLYDTQEVCADDSVERESEVESYLRKEADKVSLEPCENFNKEDSYSGFRGFTSIRVASIRASGLAARARAATKNSCPDHIYLSHLRDVSRSRVQNNEDDIQNDYNENRGKLRNLNSCKVGSTAARIFFMEDEAGTKHTDENILNIPESENCLAGLSYANSQQPGDLSQANALEVVDKFLEQNMVDYDLGVHSTLHIAEKPKAASRTQGSRNLAKSSLLQNIGGLCEVYDWDDTREDEGGGEFLIKKKENFFQGGGKKKRSLTEPRKHKYSDLKRQKEEDQSYSNRKLRNSDLGLMLNKRRVKEKPLDSGKEVSSKNLTKYFDEEINLASESRLSENNISINDTPEIQNIGLDTQIAAEAMQTLCFEVQLADNSCPNQGAGNKERVTKKIQSSSTVPHSKQSLTQTIKYPDSVRVVTRLAKRIKSNAVNTSNKSPLSSVKQSKNAMNRLVDSNNVVLVHEKGCPPSKLDLQKNGRHVRSGKKSCLQDQLCFSMPVAHKTRKCAESSCSKGADALGKQNDLINAPDLRKKRTYVKNRNAKIITIDQLRKLRSVGFNTQLNVKDDDTSASNVDVLQGKRSQQEMQLVGEESEKHSDVRLKKARTMDTTISPNSGRNHANHPSTLNSPQKQFNEKIEGKTTKSVECKEKNVRLEASPGERSGITFSACTTPANCATLVNDASPICMGDEYRKQSCKNLSRFSLIKELDRLVSGSSSIGGTKEMRKRREVINIRVLFSQHLDVDVVRQQKKILARLGAAVASSMSEATHFVADEFVRTRNMLEAIAFGKPVVTRLWLDSCGQASCLIDEKNYILRDVRKEKEFGFSMPVSLSRACQHPLLQGQKVLITPNTKPGKDILVNLVKAVHGLTVEILGRSVLKDEKLSDDLLILSCEEDYDLCVPVLEKGGAVYSSELLLNGIVKQKLEYERHRLFADHVKKTRSTIWLKKKDQFLPVTKRT